MRLQQRLTALEARIEPTPAHYRHAQDLTDGELEAIISGADTTTRLITTPAEREAVAKMSDKDLTAFMQIADKALSEARV